MTAPCSIEQAARERLSLFTALGTGLAPGGPLGPPLPGESLS